MRIDTTTTISISGQEIPAIYIAIALPVIAVLYVAYSLYMAEDALMAKMEAVTAQEEGIAAKRAEADELKVRTKEVDKVRSEIEDLEKSITLLKAQIPSEAQVSVLLFDVERITRQSQGTLESFQPGQLRAFGSKSGGGDAAGGESTSDIQELPVTIKATATYPEVINFLAQLNAYERKLNVSNLSLSPGAKGGVVGSGGQPGTNDVGFKNTLNVEFTLLAYVLRTNGAQP